MIVPILAALSAAILFAVAAALQHRSAGLVVDAGRLPTRAITKFMSMTLRHPLWIVGSVADIAGFALHAFALRNGPLTLVQPLLVTGVIFALPLRRLLEHRPPRREELGWAAALAAGLVLFLIVATPAYGVAQPPDPAPTTFFCALIGIGILTCFVAGRHATGTKAAVFLGTGTALAFGAAAGLLKETMALLGNGVGALATAWPLYALIAVGAVGFVLKQLAYQAGPLSFSLPAITTVNPVLGLVIGVAVFDEQFRYGPTDLLIEALGLALVVAATVGLTRSSPRSRLPQGTEPGKARRPTMTASAPSEVP
jgi:hypothetical protein